MKYLLHPGFLEKFVNIQSSVMFRLLFGLGIETDKTKISVNASEE